MDKKGVSLDITVKFIAGIVFLVLIIFVLVTTGILDAFTETMNVLICQFSVYTRGTFMKILETMLPFILGFMLLFIAIGGIGSAKTLKSSTASILQKIDAAQTLGTGSIIVVLTSIFIFSLLTHVPLFCSINNINFREMPAENFPKLIGSRSIDTFNSFGGGGFDPLWGLTPNPRTFYVFTVNLDETIDMKTIVEGSYEIFNDSWPFRELGHENFRIHLYCPNNEGNNYNNWGSCVLQENEDYIIYVMFLDKVPWDSRDSYQSSLCNMRGSDLYNVEDDSVVWCVRDG